MKRWFNKQLKTMLGVIPEIGAPLPASFPPLTDYDDPMASAMTPVLSGYWDEGGKVTRAKLGLDPEKWEVHDPHLHQTDPRCIAEVLPRDQHPHDEAAQRGSTRPSH